MKRLIFLSIAVYFISSILPFSAKGQDTTEVAWAKHIKQAIDNRPNPKYFSEDEAWEIVTGKKEESHIFKEKKEEFKDFHLLKRKSVSKYVYLRSTTASKDGWWYQKILSFDPGVWETNTIPVVFFTVSILFLIFSLTLVNKYYAWAKKELEGSPNFVTPLSLIKNFFISYVMILFFFSILLGEILIFISMIITLLDFLIFELKIKKLEKSEKK